ncbi:hypothetical protein A9A89_1418 [Bifidobacterium psychraerophilum DSM 22366]|uniref:Uncharacterized protein n=1 Tax=Bifidobacterium psychraerophilum TaxID=218140 RepID=A0A087CGH0_9BIFI|nr:hypothetical protein BPSY_1221 [Bifidobacterium psychraerophilum]PKA95171.1 hypothetical protein A9A89_1418 [Bifidobacterium psychraerophilum DSM 22366]
MLRGRRLFIILTTTAVVVAIGGPCIWDAFINNGRYPIDWQAWWAFCTFLIALVAAAVGWNEYQLHKKGSAEQDRPYIDFSIEMDEWDAYICIKNIGRTTALDVTIDYPEGTQSSGFLEAQDVNPSDITEEWIKRDLGRFISALPTGHTYKYEWLDVSPPFRHIKARNPPPPLSGKIHYKDFKDNSYEQLFKIDVADFFYSDHKQS